MYVIIRMRFLKNYDNNTLPLWSSNSLLTMYVCLMYVITNSANKLELKFIILQNYHLEGIIDKSHWLSGVSYHILITTASSMILYFIYICIP